MAENDDSGQVDSRKAELFSLLDEWADARAAKSNDKDSEKAKRTNPPKPGFLDSLFGTLE